MKTIELASLAAVSGGIAQNTAASWSRPSLQHGSWWNQAAPTWNAPSAPTQPLGPFVPEQSKGQWA